MDRSNFRPVSTLQASTLLMASSLTGINKRKIKEGDLFSFTLWPTPAPYGTYLMESLMGTAMNNPYQLSATYLRSRTG